MEDFKFNDTEKGYSSGHRELLAILKTIEANRNDFKKFNGKRIYWQTDSQNVVIFLNKGSRKPKIQADVFKIKIMERELNIVISPVWTPRSHDRIMLADLGSKIHSSTDEWGIDVKEIKHIFKQFEFSPSVDTMATRQNAIFDLFYSKIPQIGSAGINFYTIDLDTSLTYYCCPPISEVIYAFRKLTSKSNIKAVLVVPAWKSANFWPVIFNGHRFHEAIKHFIYFKPKIKAYNKAFNFLVKQSEMQEFIALHIIS